MTTRWTWLRKAALVGRLRGGELTRDEVLQEMGEGSSEEELVAWERDIDDGGPQALRLRVLQRDRPRRSAKPPVAETTIGALWRQAVQLSELADKLESQDGAEASREAAQILDRQAGELEGQIQNLAPVTIDDVRVFIEMLSWRTPSGDEDTEKLLNPIRSALRALCGEPLDKIGEGEEDGT